MKITTMWFALSLLPLLLLTAQYARADTSVHILSKNYNQLITSSTLNWISESHYSASKDFVIGGFENVPKPDGSLEPKRPIFVCRALHNGVWVAGGRRDGENKCTVSLTGSVRSYERYQLLENVESAARIGWVNWTKYYTPQPGTVASSEKLYVARLALEEELPKQTYYIGTLNAQDSLGIITYVKEDGEEGTSDKGQLLMETEPASYELNSVKLNNARTRVVKRQPRVLGEATISNTGSSPGNMAEAFTYEYTYVLYWGQGNAMFRGLNTKITLVNKTKLPDIQWGIETRENRTSVYTVEVYLEPGTAVNVTLNGTYASVETPYSGKLYSHYDDNSSINTRHIIDERREEHIIDVTPVIGPVYFIGNLSLVPTPPAAPITEEVSITTTTTTTTATTTTTTPATTMGLTTQPTTTRQQQYNLDESQTEQQYSKENVGVDENSIVERPQGDDGGPLSLKDKDHSAAVTLSASLVTIIASILLAT